MDNKIFSETLRDLRKSKGMSQEQLSEKLGISVQAVSKWECAQSYPDIELLPVIADIMEVSIDYLLRGCEAERVACNAGAIENADNSTGVKCSIGEKFELPDDNVLRIIQFKGRTLLKIDDYDPRVKIPLYIEEECLHVETVEIWGSADIEGNIAGSVTAGGGVNCGNVGAHVDADGGVNCGRVGAHVSAGGGVNCGQVGAHVNAGGGVNCGSVGAHIDAGGGVTSGDIGGDVNAGGDVKCANVDGNVNAGRNVDCEDVAGDVSAGGDIECGDVEGDVVPGGNATCENVEGDVVPGGNATCGNVEGDVVAGSNVKIVCDNIEGDVQMESGELRCKEISGDVECGGAIYYEK